MPFDQTTVPAQSLTLNFTFVPAHTILSISSEITVGAGKMAFNMVVCVNEATLVQPPRVQVA